MLVVSVCCILLATGSFQMLLLGSFQCGERRAECVSCRNIASTKARPCHCLLVATHDNWVPSLNVVGIGEQARKTRHEWPTVVGLFNSVDGQIGLGAAWDSGLSI